MTLRARPDRNTSRLRVFREEEFDAGDDFAEEPTSPSQRIRIAAAAIDPLEQTDVPLPLQQAPRIRAAKVTAPLPLPRPPRRP